MSRRERVQCDKKRQLSGIPRRCDRGFEHSGVVHHATTVTGVDRYWVIGIQTEFATEADAHDELARRNRVDDPELPPPLWE